MTCYAVSVLRKPEMQNCHIHVLYLSLRYINEMGKKCYRRGDMVFLISLVFYKSDVCRGRSTEIDISRQISQTKYAKIFY
jgi:hypothetical protein